MVSKRRDLQKSGIGHWRRILKLRTAQLADALGPVYLLPKPSSQNDSETNSLGSVRAFPKLVIQANFSNDTI